MEDQQLPAYAGGDTADIVGRQFAIDRVRSFLSDRDRGTMLITA